MKCVFCGESDSKVNETRTCDDGYTIRRRRECLKCHKRFTTYERSENIQVYIVKKDGRREVFDLDKIKSGMIKSCEKRPISMKRIEDSVERIWQGILQKGVHEIQSDDVGRMVMDELKDMDLVAYLRFASVYLRFDDVSSFRDEIEKLMSETDDGSI